MSNFPAKPPVSFLIYVKVFHNFSHQKQQNTKYLNSSHLLCFRKLYSLWSVFVCWVTIKYISYHGPWSMLCESHCVCVCVCVCVYCVQLFATPWTIAHQAPLSTQFSRQECWSPIKHNLINYSPMDELGGCLDFVCLFVCYFRWRAEQCRGGCLVCTLLGIRWDFLTCLKRLCFFRDTLSGLYIFTAWNKNLKYTPMVQ